MRKKAFIIGIFIILTTLIQVNSFCYGSEIWVNVKEYGSDGLKGTDSTEPIRKALDFCKKNGGGTVYFPSGEYTVDEIVLFSNTGLYLEKGSSLFFSRKEGSCPHGAFIFSQDSDNISIEGAGRIEGQSAHTLKEYKFTDPNVNPHAEFEKKAGRAMNIPYPVAPSPQMVLFVNCSNIKIKDVIINNSGSWTVHLRLCNNVLVDGVSIYTSLSEGVWADGIDIDSCKDVRIANSVIETGDDSICLKTMKECGENKTCENVVVTNCRLTSSSCAFKFGDEIYSDIRNVMIGNCVITNSSRGIGICLREKGNIKDVVFSDLIIDCARHEWYWWGDGDPIFFMMEESIYAKNKTVPGKIENVVVSNVIAHGKGTSKIYGFPGKNMENISFENVKLFLSEDETNLSNPIQGIFFQGITDLSLNNFEIHIENPVNRIENAMIVKDAENVTIDSFNGSNLKSTSVFTAISFENVNGGTIKDSLAFPGTSSFISVRGEKTERINIYHNDFGDSKVPLYLGKEIIKGKIKTMGNIP